MEVAFKLCQTEYDQRYRHFSIWMKTEQFESIIFRFKKKNKNKRKQ